MIPLAGSPFLRAEASTTRNEEVETCLGCHGDKDASFKLPSGEKQSLYVARDVFEKSVHGARQGCTGCHPAQAEVPHPEVKAKDKAEFARRSRISARPATSRTTRRRSTACTSQILAKGGSAPFCVDCHGAHDIMRPTVPRTRVSDTCGACHSRHRRDVREERARHGARAGNPDVPVCTDCHHAHDIADPRTTDWRLKTIDALREVPHEQDR